ncbi:MAG: hypothetical protein NC355_06070 [Blautia sp.]|nr:hypothetical protein [Blautia sp.]
MSQAKVEQYKKDKANRRKLMQKEKAQRMAARVCAWAILLAVVGWAGYSAYSYFEAKQPTETVYTDLTAMSDYISGLETEAAE